MRWLLLMVGAVAITIVVVGCGAATTSVPVVEVVGDGETAVLPTATEIAQPIPACNWQGASFRFLALGDSYTIGQSVDLADSWPWQLMTRLRDRDVPVADPDIVARTGWTTADLLDGIVEAGPRGPYDLVSLQIGVNNQYQGLDSDRYRDDFRALLQQAIGFAGGDAGRVLVLSTPDYGVTPFANRLDQVAIAAEIDELNGMARETAVSLNARFVDITPISRQAGRTPQLIADDRLHPSSLMYNLWVTEMLPVVCDMITE